MKRLVQDMCLPGTRDMCLFVCRGAKFVLALQIAVLKETEGKGPYCSLVMAVVVVKDVVVFILFAITLEMTNLVGSLTSL